MKKVVLVLFTCVMVLGASAQHGRFRGGWSYGHRIYPRVSIGIGYLPYAPFGYGYYGYPYPVYRVGYSRLEMQLHDINQDYKERIWQARHDHSLSHHERKLKVHQLKSERDQALIEARRNYYNRRTY